MPLKPSISVVIPTYNRADYLVKAISSVMNQSRSVDEIIVVDDGSTDHTRLMLEKNYPKIEYYYQENRGVSAARNMGIAKARSDWLAFLDSDDEWLPKKLEKQLEANQSSAVRVCHTNEIWIRNGIRVNQMKKHEKQGGWIYEKCLPLCVISPSAVMIHQSIFDAVGVFDESLPACEDYDLWLRICAYYPVSYHAEPLIIKRGGHPDQLSARYWGMDRFRIASLEKMINDPVLSARYKTKTLEIIIKKIKIYIIGAVKRDKKDEVTVYTKKKEYYEEILEGLAANLNNSG